METVSPAKRSRPIDGQLYAGCSQYVFQVYVLAGSSYQGDPDVYKRQYDDAVRLIRKDNPFPTVCAHICEHPCEARCRRQLIDTAVNIRGIKRYAVAVSYTHLDVYKRQVYSLINGFLPNMN